MHIDLDLRFPSCRPQSTGSRTGFYTVSTPGSAGRSPPSVSRVGVSLARAFGASSASRSGSAPRPASGSPETIYSQHLTLLFM